MKVGHDIFGNSAFCEPMWEQRYGFTLKGLSFLIQDGFLLYLLTILDIQLNRSLQLSIMKNSI